MYTPWHVTMALRMLQKYTPETDNLSIYETVDQAWAYLDKKYANSTAVSARLIEDFIKDRSNPGKNDDQKLLSLHNKTMKLYSRLKVVSQETQLTHNIYLMNQAFYQMPEKFADRLSIIRKAMDAKGAGYHPDAMWVAFKTYVEEEIETIRTYRPYNITSNKNEVKSDPPKSKNKVDSVKPAKTPKAGSDQLHSDPAIKKMQQKFDACPACSKYHTWRGKYGEKASSKLSDCDV